MKSYPAHHCPGRTIFGTNISSRFSLSFQFRFIRCGIAGTASTHSFRKSLLLRKNAEILLSRDREKMKQKRREVVRRIVRRLRASHPSVFAALVRKESANHLRFHAIEVRRPNAIGDWKEGRTLQKKREGQKNEGGFSRTRLTNKI